MGPREIVAVEVEIREGWEGPWKVSWVGGGKEGSAVARAG